MYSLACESLAGGQGKSTVALMTGRLLAQQKYPVLLVDADPQSSLSTFVGHEVQKNSPTLLELLRGEVQPVDAIYPTDFENLFIIPSDGGLDSVQDYLAASGVGAFLLRQQLETVSDTFKFCIIDSPPQRSQLCLSTIGAADALVLPMEAGVKGFASLSRTLDLLDTLRRTRILSAEIIGVIPFRDKWVGFNRTKYSQKHIDALADLIGKEKILPSIRESEKFKEAINERSTPRDLGCPDLEYPIEVLIERLINLVQGKEVQLVA
jgi:chromosome partitioning protein